MKIALVLSALALACALSPLSAVAGIPSGLVHDGTIYDAERDQTAFWYSIWPTMPAASHVVLGICGEIVSVSWPHVVTGYDPTTELSGLKLDNLPTLQAPLAVKVVMKGQISAVVIPYRMKAGQEVWSRTTVGPGCAPNAVALRSLSTTYVSPVVLGLPVWSSSAAGAGSIPSWLSAKPPFLAERASGVLAQPAARRWAEIVWRTLLRFGRVVPSP